MGFLSRSNSKRNADVLAGNSRDSLSSDDANSTLQRQPSRLRQFFMGSKKTPSMSPLASIRDDNSPLQQQHPLDAGLCKFEGAPGGHLHLPVHLARSTLYNNTAGEEGDQAVAFESALAHYMLSVDAEYPEVAFQHPPRALPDPPSLPPSSLAINSSHTENHTSLISLTGKVFVRLSALKVYAVLASSHQDLRVRVKVGPVQFATSCPIPHSQDISSSPKSSPLATSDHINNRKGSSKHPINKWSEWFVLDVTQAEGPIGEHPLIADFGKSGGSRLNLSSMATAANQSQLTIELVNHNNALRQPNANTNNHGSSLGFLARIRSRASSSSNVTRLGNCTAEGDEILGSLSMPLALLAMDDVKRAQSVKKNHQPSSHYLPRNQPKANHDDDGGGEKVKDLGVSGTFYLVDPGTQEAVGQVAMHALCTPQSFLVGRALTHNTSNADPPRHSGSLTFLRRQSSNNISGQAMQIKRPFWQRSWAVLQASDLVLFDPLKKDRPQDWLLPMNRIRSISLHNTTANATNRIAVGGEEGPVCVANVLEITLADPDEMSRHPKEFFNSTARLNYAQKYFLHLPQHPTNNNMNSKGSNDTGGQQRLLAYADSGKEALAWANQLSLAVWGQPWEDLNGSPNSEDIKADPLGESLVVKFKAIKTSA